MKSSSENRGPERRDRREQPQKDDQNLAVAHAVLARSHEAKNNYAGREVSGLVCLAGGEDAYREFAEFSQPAPARTLAEVSEVSRTNLLYCGAERAFGAPGRGPTQMSLDELATDLLRCVSPRFGILQG